VTEDAEISIELNPGSADLDKLRRYKAAGINRISIGAQSFCAGALEFLRRIHTAKETVRCVLDARRAGFENIGLDLIFGIPGQSLSDFEKDLEAAIMLDPHHISYYSLQIEEKTPIYEDYTKGLFDEADEIEDRRMYHLASAFLSKNGFFQYEISNSAKPGKESRHNLKYWSMESYVGFGVSAHSYLNGKRFSNTSELASYLTAENTFEMTEWTHENTLTDDMSEFIFLGLRRTAGIELSAFHSRFGKDFWELYGAETEKLIGRGLLEQKGETLRLTVLGLDVANIVFSEYV
jgi:oxygen-independent coproporphyrinogen-3 oxidase